MGQVCSGERGEGGGDEASKGTERAKGTSGPPQILRQVSDPTKRFVNAQGVIDAAVQNLKTDDLVGNLSVWGEEEREGRGRKEGRVVDEFGEW